MKVIQKKTLRAKVTQHLNVRAYFCHCAIIIITSHLKTEIIIIPYKYYAHVSIEIAYNPKEKLTINKLTLHTCNKHLPLISFNQNSNLDSQKDYASQIKHTYFQRS